MPAYSTLVRVGLLLSAASCAADQSGAEAEYLREKREAVRTLSRHRDPLLAPGYDSLLKNLDRRLRAIVGEVNVPGLPRTGHLNLEGFYDGDAVFRMLDGLVFRTDDYSKQVFVTTPTIMSAWLADNARGYSIDSALNSPGVLTAAIVGEAVMMRYADLPMADTKRKGVASAMLILTAQDIGPWPPDKLLVSVVRSDRIFIVQVPPAVAIDTISVCNARLMAAYNARPHPSVASDDAAHTKYRACYAEHLSRIPGIEKIIGQVDSIVALLPRR